MKCRRKTTVAIAHSDSDLGTPAEYTRAQLSLVKDMIRQIADQTMGGMHNIVRRPVAVSDRVEVRPIMYVALTYDHRVVDGREAVQFLVAVKESIESPDRLMLSL